MYVIAASLDRDHDAQAQAHIDTPAARRSLVAQAGFFLRHASPLLLLGNALVLTIARVVVAGFTWMDAVAVVLIAAWWPMQEWVFHRFLLHMKPRSLGLSPGSRLRFDPGFARAHRAHHRRPWIVQTTLLPTTLVLVLIPLQPIVWGLAIPSLTLALTVATTYAWSALLYEWIHYLCHSHYVPKSRYYRRIWKNHRLHHFKNERNWFAFTVPHVDAWMGTEPAADAVEQSASVRTLGVDDEIDV